MTCSQRARRAFDHVSLATAPPAPFIPEEWHGKKVAAVVACWAGDPAEGEDIVKPLRSLGTPITDLFGPIPYLDLQQLFDPAWQAGAANYFTSAFLDRMPDEAIDTVVDYQRAPPTCRCVPSCTFITSAERLREFRPAHCLHRSHLDIRPLLRRAYTWPSRAFRNIDWARAARDALAIYGKGGMYVNFRRWRRRRCGQLSIRDLRSPAGSQESIRPAQRIPIQHQYSTDNPDGKKQ